MPVGTQSHIGQPGIHVFDGTVRSIARSIVASCDRSYDESLLPTTDRAIIRGNIRFGIAGYKFWTWPSTLLRLICPLRSPTTSATSRTSFLRFIYDSKLFWSPLRRNLVVSPVWLVLNMTYDLVATDLPLAITHDHCDQSYVLSTICLRFQIVLVAATS